MLKKVITYFLFIILLSSFFLNNSYAWDCKTHAYIAKKAGIRIPEAACMPDIIRDENHSLLAPFHYHDAAPETFVTVEYIEKYIVQEITISIDERTLNILVPHQAGVLYWKIVDIYKGMEFLEKTKPDNQLAYEYYLVSIAHYIGDLSQPLHNFPYGNSPASDGKIYLEEGKFNKEKHLQFDEAFTFYLTSDPEIDEKIDKAIKQIKLSSAEDLKKEISNIANSAIKIARKCYKENRMPSEDEIISQIASSISLLKAVIISTN